MIENIHRNAAAQLNCTPGQECPGIDDRTRPSVTAQAQLNPSNALVYGITIRTAAAEIERIMAGDQTVLAVEILRGTPLMSPIHPTAPARY